MNTRKLKLFDRFSCGEGFGLVLLNNNAIFLRPSGDDSSKSYRWYISGLCDIPSDAELVEDPGKIPYEVNLAFSVACISVAVTTETEQ